MYRGICGRVVLSTAEHRTEAELLTEGRMKQRSQKLGRVGPTAGPVLFHAQGLSFVLAILSLPHPNNQSCKA